MLMIIEKIVVAMVINSHTTSIVGIVWVVINRHSRHRGCSNLSNFQLQTTSRKSTTTPGFIYGMLSTFSSYPDRSD